MVIWSVGKAPMCSFRCFYFSLASIWLWIIHPWIVHGSQIFLHPRLILLITSKTLLPAIYSGIHKFGTKERMISWYLHTRWCHYIWKLMGLNKRGIFISSALSPGTHVASDLWVLIKILLYSNYILLVNQSDHKFAHVMTPGVGVTKPISSVPLFS